MNPLHIKAYLCKFDEMSSDKHFELKSEFGNVIPNPWLQ